MKITSIEPVDNKVYIQYKLDGHRCIIDRNGMWSRNRKPITSSPHILETLRAFFEKYPTAILDGELYNHELHDDFDKLCSLIKKQKPTLAELMESEEKVQYYIYDCLQIAEYTEKDGFAARNDLLTKELKRLANHRHIVIVPTFTLNSAADVEPMHDSFVELGYEGLMIRQDMPYKRGRTLALLKYKHFDEEEFRILDIQPGRGGKARMAARVCFRTKDGKPFSAGIIGKTSYCVDLLNRKEEFIGTMATVKFFKYTPAGIPRFPKMKEANRTDNEEEDED